MRFWRPLGLSLALPLLSLHPAQASEISVRVEPRVELAAVLCRLAGFEEYQVQAYPPYDRAAAAHFDRFADHPSVQVVKTLRAERKIAYNATVEAALLAEPVTWQPRVKLAPLPAELQYFWDEASLRTFLAAAAKFEKDTGAAAFFAGQRTLFSQAEEQVRGELARIVDLGWFERQFGVRASSRFTVILALGNGQMNFGSSFPLPDGSHEVYATVGAPRHAEGQAFEYPLAAVGRLLVHEFSHSYVNPWVNQHEARLLPAAKRLFKAVSQEMQAAAYSTPQILLYESLVRANTIRYFRDHGDNFAAEKGAEDDRTKGFWWTADLAALVGNTGGTGETTPRFPAASAAIFAFFDAWSENPAARITEQREVVQRAEKARLAELRARGPQLVRLLPADGDTQVAANVTVLEIEFDRPMNGAIQITGEVPEVTGAPSWDGEKRTLRIPVKLAPGTTYSLGLNGEEAPGEGFGSRDGEWFAPRPWRFTVAPAPKGH